MSVKRKEEAGDEWSVREVFGKALTKNADWQDKDDLLDVLYWGRQVLSLVLGVFWGLIPLKGVFAILIYLLISTLSGHFYVANFQGQDEESYGGFMELAKEGFAASVATFLIAWITVYSAVHFY